MKKTKGSFFKVLNLTTVLFSMVMSISTTSNAGGTIIADSYNDFSGVQGQSNWYYGYYDLEADIDKSYNYASDFQLMTEYNSSTHSWTVQQSAYWTSLSNHISHPHHSARKDNGSIHAEQWSIRRWVSDISGTITIDGSLVWINPTTVGDGYTGHIIVDGIEVWSGHNNPGDWRGVSFSVPVIVSEGTKVDFAVDAGANETCDWAQFMVQIKSGAVTPPPSGILIADSYADFSGVQGQNNWYYGYYDREADADKIYDYTSDFQIMIQYDSSTWYVQSSAYWTSLSNHINHPHHSGRKDDSSIPAEQWSIRRWVSNLSGTITIDGSLVWINPTTVGDGYTGHIIVDGIEVWSGHNNPGDWRGVSFSVPVIVSEGTKVDFAVDAGANETCDWAQFIAQLRLQPQPIVSVNLTGDAFDLAHDLIISWDGILPEGAVLESCTLDGVDMMPYVISGVQNSAFIPAICFPSSTSLAFHIGFRVSSTLVEETRQLNVESGLKGFKDLSDAMPWDVLAIALDKEWPNEVGESIKYLDFAAFIRDLMNAVSDGDNVKAMNILLSQGESSLFSSVYGPGYFAIDQFSQWWILKPNRDLYSDEEWELLQQQGVLTRSFTAYGIGIKHLQEWFAQGWNWGIWAPPSSWQPPIIGFPARNLDAAFIELGQAIQNIQDKIGKWFEDLLHIFVMSPVQIEVEDPLGHVLSQTVSEIPYSFLATTVDSNTNHYIEHYYIYMPISGQYKIFVSPAPNSLPTDTYSIIAEIRGERLIVSDGEEVGNIPPDGYVITINTPPIADAGLDQTVYAWIDGIAEVDLDGSGSYDEDGDTLTYKWNWTIDGNTFNADGVKPPTIELPVGQHVISLIVNDGIVDSEPNEVNITVIGPIEGNLNVTPKVLNSKSFMPRIMATLRLPKSITRDQLDSNEPILLYPGEIEADWMWISRDFDYKCRAWNTTIFASFDKDELMNAIDDNGQVELVVVGQLKTGQYFFGTDDIRVICPGNWPWHRPWQNHRWNRWCHRPVNCRH